METTFAERIKKAMMGPPRVSGVALAKACGITPTSVSDWRSGKSKTIEGKNLLSAAKCLGVRPEWLANGIGPMRSDSINKHIRPVEDNVAFYAKAKSSNDKWITEATVILKRLKPSQREGAVAALRVYVQNLGPPRDGQALQVAGG